MVLASTQKHLIWGSDLLPGCNAPSPVARHIWGKGGRAGVHRNRQLRCTSSVP